MSNEDPGKAVMKVGAGIMGCGCAIMLFLITVPIAGFFVAMAWAMISP